MIANYCISLVLCILRRHMHIQHGGGNYCTNTQYNNLEVSSIMLNCLGRSKEYYLKTRKR